MTHPGPHEHEHHHHDHDHEHDEPDFGPHGHGHEDDLVEPLVPRIRVGRYLLLGAVIAAVTLATTVARRNADDGDRPSASGRPTTTTTVVRGGADDTVRAWIDDVAAGDVEAARARTGPASAAAVAEAGGDLGGFLVESREGYGGWADSADVTITSLDLGTGDDGVTRAVVVLSGTWTGEGDDGPKVEALPAARRDGEPWRVEPWAFPQRDGGRLVLVSPPPGVGGLPPDEAIEVTAPGDGEFTFRLDDGEPTRVAGTPTGGGRSRARFDPPGAMTSRTHLATVAFVGDGGTFLAHAFTFLVEG